jgi:hypothetical protein
MLVPISFGREPVVEGASISPHPPNGSLDDDKDDDGFDPPTPPVEVEGPLLPDMQLTSSLSDLFGDDIAADEEDEDGNVLW